MELQGVKTRIENTKFSSSPLRESDPPCFMTTLPCPLRPLWIYLSVSLTNSLLPDHVAQRLTRRLKSPHSINFPTPLSSGNTVIGGGWKKGGHAPGDDKRLKKLIILVLLSSSFKEGFFVGHATGCTFDLLFAHEKVVKWRF